MGILQIPDKKYIIKILLLNALILIVISTVSGFMLLTHSHAYYLKSFYVNSNYNLPRWFGTILQFVGAVLAYLISLQYKKREKNRLFWKLLSMIFIFLSIAKSTYIDEFLFGLVRKELGILLFPINSLVFGALLVLLFLIVFSRFYLSLDNIVRKAIFLSAVIYIVLGLFFEAAGKIIFHTNFLIIILSGLEELCEMTGSIIFIYALLLQLDLMSKKKQVIQ